MYENEANNSKINILLFERDPNIISVIQNGFENHSCHFEIIKNVMTVMKVINNNDPDIIIAGSDFPEMSGLDLLKKVKELGNKSPVVLFGPKSEGIILEAFRNGAADYWPKPLLGKEIKERINFICSNLSNYKKSCDIDAVMDAVAIEKKELKGLLKITSSLNVSGDTKVSLNHLTDLAAEIMNCEAASIMLVNERENVLEFVVATGDKRYRLETIKVPMGEGIAGWVALHGKPQIVNETGDDKRFTGRVDEESGFETRQILAVPMVLDSEIIGVLEVINTKDKHDFKGNDLQTLNDMAERMATVIAATRKIEDQQNYFIQTTNIIVRAIEKKDIYAEGHSWKVAEYCHKIATAMGLSNTEKNDLHFGSLLHDIGKLVLPSYIFNKRDLSEREKELIKQHPVQGAKLLEPITLWRSVVPYVLYHHEAWDGSGYPFGRKGDSVPLCARIIGIGEAFSVMRATSTYKKQLTLKESILEIMRMSGKQFDPDIVKVFVGVLEKENSPK